MMISFSLRKTFPHTLLLLLIFLVSVIILKDSFRLSLYGDDWLALYIYLFQYGPAIGKSYFDISQYISPYGPTAFFMGIIHAFFGLNSLPYFIVSFVTRISLAFVIYLFLFINTRNKIAAFTGALFFAIGEIGLGTTDWVFNFNTYIGGALFLLSLIIYNSGRTKNDLKKVLFALILFILSVVTVPVRMHGAFIFIIFNELWIYLKTKTKSNLKKSITMSFIWIMIFIFLNKISVFGVGNFNVYVIESLTSSLEAINSGRSDHLLYPIMTFGNLLFTDKLLETGFIPILTINNSSLSWFISFLIPIWFFFIITTAVISYIFGSNNYIKKIFTISFFGLVWIFLVNIFIQSNPSTFNHPNHIFLTITGGFLILILTEITLLAWSKNKLISQGIIYSFVWFWAFAAVPLFYSPFSYISSSTRYLTLPGISIALTIGFLLTYKLPRTKFFLLISIIGLIFLVHIQSTQKYLSGHAEVRSADKSNKIWSQIFQKTPALSQKEPSLFYIESTEKNKATFGDVVALGFAGVLVLNGKVNDKVGGPYLLTTIDDLRSALTDGESMRAYNTGRPKVFKWNQVYAYRLTDDLTIIDIKDKIKRRLQEMK